MPNRKLVTHGPDHLAVWDCLTEKVEYDIAKGKSVSYCSALSPKADQVAIGYLNGDIDFHDVKTGKRTNQFTLGSRCNGMHFSPDGRCLLTWKDDLSAITILDLPVK